MDGPPPGEEKKRRRGRRGSAVNSLRNIYNTITGAPVPAPELPVELEVATSTPTNGRVARRASTTFASPTNPTAPVDADGLVAGMKSPTSHAYEDLGARTGETQDAANLAAAMAEARRLVKSGMLTRGEMRQIEAVDALAAAESESYEKRVMQWMALSAAGKTPRACCDIVQELVGNHEPVLALDFLRAHAAERGWLKPGSLRAHHAVAADRRDELDAKVQMRQLYATALADVGSLELAKGLILELHAEGRADLNILTLLGRTQLELGVRAKNRGALADTGIAESEMASARSVFLEAFRRAKRAATIEIDAHHAQERGSAAAAASGVEQLRTRRPSSTRRPLNAPPAPPTTTGLPPAVRGSSPIAVTADESARRTRRASLKNDWEVRYHAAMADRIHSEWCESRKREPRYKVCNGEVIDIANTAFADLPEIYRTSNIDAAKSACSCVDDAVAMGVPLDGLFVEMAAKVQHEDWMRRPASQDASQRHLHVPFVELDDVEKQKDRDIIYIAIRLNHDLRLRSGGDLTSLKRIVDGAGGVDIKTVKAALHAGMELARTAQMTGNKELAISTAYEVISLATLLPLAVAESDFVVQGSLGEVSLHIGEFGRAISHYRIAARLMARRREWKVLQQAKEHSLRTVTVVSTELLKDQIMRVLSARGASTEDSENVDPAIVKVTERMELIRRDIEAQFGGLVPCVTVCVGDPFGSDTPASSPTHAGATVSDSEHLESEAVRQVGELVEEGQTGFGFAMALPGADVIFLETVLGRGGDVYIVLPCPRSEFEAAFLGKDGTQDIAALPSAGVSSRGNRWASRVATLLQRAKRVYEVGLPGALHNPSAMEYCFRVMTGLAIVQAKKVGARLEVVAVVTPTADKGETLTLGQSTARVGRGLSPSRRGGPASAADVRHRISARELVNHLWRDWRWDPLVVCVGEMDESSPQWALSAEHESAAVGLSKFLAASATIEEDEPDWKATSREKARRISLGLKAGHDLGRVLDDVNQDLSPSGGGSPVGASSPGMRPHSGSLVIGTPPHGISLTEQLEAEDRAASEAADKKAVEQAADIADATQQGISLAAHQWARKSASGTDCAGRKSRVLGGRRRSFRLGHTSGVVSLGAVGGSAERAGSGGATPLKVRTKLARELVQGRRQDVVGVLFADAVGFSKLREVHMYAFIKAFLGRIGELVEDIPEGSERRPIVSNTWGDGIFMAFNTVRAAGHFALQLARVVKETDWTAYGLPRTMNVRVGVHAGPAIALTDPLTGRPNLIGPHISHAARIEPITPHGEVYVAASELVSTCMSSLQDSVRLTCYSFAYVLHSRLLRSYGSFQFAALLHLEESLASSGSMPLSPFATVVEGAEIEPPTREEKVKAYAEGIDTTLVRLRALLHLPPLALALALVSLALCSRTILVAQVRRTNPLREGLRFILALPHQPA